MVVRKWVGQCGYRGAVAPPCRVDYLIGRTVEVERVHLFGVKAGAARFSYGLGLHENRGSCAQPYRPGEVNGALGLVTPRQETLGYQLTLRQKILTVGSNDRLDNQLRGSSR